jgi:Rps23 Pro-64 3,4-dihydroxylase Tpa1-like proline 4-hydroxylase
VNRAELATIITEKLEGSAARLREEFIHSGTVQSCTIDDLLPEQTARTIHAAFPQKETMMLKKSLREYKYVAAQMNKYDPVLEEAIYAFQDPRVVKIVSKITGIEELIPDHNLYAGGISLMAQGNFLNPHLDNSHDKDRNRYRVLNLLYYVTPDWQQSYGGNLELWDDGPKGKARELHSKFNRLAIMATHDKSWHSVNEVRHDGSRCCVSNYYFSSKSLEEHAGYHVTSFRGRPEQPVRDMVLRVDNTLRTAVRKVLKNSIANPHVYKKD